MRAQVLRGSKRKIAEPMVQIAGEVREAIVFVDEPSDAAGQAPGEDIFAEMAPFTVRGGGADYSRETLSNRIEGE